METTSEVPHILQKNEKFVTCTLEGPQNTSTCTSAASLSSLYVDNSFDIDEFKKNVQIEVKELCDERVVFELININVAFANALRRILIAEVPTIAIETVHLWQNTGVIQDEVLAHRLGLIPLKIDPDSLIYKHEKAGFTDENSIKFRLHVKCTPEDITPLNKSKSIYSKDLEWIPLSEKQEKKFLHCPPKPVHPDILITKLRPGQEIEAELYCEKNIGKVHAKWSPVATAVYKLLPVIEFPNGDLKEEANELKEICPMNVFDVEDGKSVVRKPRYCTTCRACLERFPGKVSLLKNKQHFIFTVESTGCLPASTLFERAIHILKEKALTVKKNIATTFSKCEEHESL